MLLQTNSYIVPKEKRAEHARLMRRFRQILNRIGCDDFEVYEQVGANWGNASSTGRFVQIMRFRDRKHQLAVQNAERNDPAAQQLIAEFCELINYNYQVQQGWFAVGFYGSVLPVAPVQVHGGDAAATDEFPDDQQQPEPDESAAFGAHDLGPNGEAIPDQEPVIPPSERASSGEGHLVGPPPLDHQQPTADDEFLDIPLDEEQPEPSEPPGEEPQHRGHDR